MTRNLAALVAVFSLLILSSVESAGPHEKLAEARSRHVGPMECGTPSPCATCATQTPILESGRPPMLGEGGTGGQLCTLIDTSAAWDAYCADNVVPDCPLLDNAFFAEHTVVAVVVDTVTPRPCEGSADPVWKLDCIRNPFGAATVRVVKQRPGGSCFCSAIPQHLQRLFLASAVPKSRATQCRACEERHTIGCLP